MKLLILLLLSVNLLLSNIGEVTIVKGNATVNRNVGAIKAHNHMKLLKNDIVNTQDGRLQMHFIDNTVISLGKDSKFIIKEYLYEEGSKEVASTFIVEEGFAKIITGAIGKMMPDLFVLQTSTTTITPHGTVWTMEIKKDSEYYSVLNGSVSLSFNDGSDRTIEIQAGESALLSTGLNSANKRVVKKLNKVTITKHNNKTTTTTKVITFGKSVEMANADIANDIRNAKESEFREEELFTATSTQKIIVNETIPDKEVVVETIIDEETTVITENETITSTTETSTVEEETSTATTSEESNDIEENDDDGNNGHGNDEDGEDSSNPGQNR
ncbi:MAG: hypothetical protein DRG78_15035 [Epsilonproteobacteria bacterium]|nr:MAG: hypothetical protein DRG78_15035 [Campylobacterota bacterium]